MKRLTLLFALIAFTLTANAQQLQIGSEAVQLGISAIDGDQSAFVNVGHDQPILGLLTARFSVSGGVIETSHDTFVYNNISETYRYNGASETELSGFLQPSVMAGFKIPVGKLNIGIYTGYQAILNQQVNHRFAPLSISLTLK